MKQYTFTKKGVEQMGKDISLPLKNRSKFFPVLGAKFDQYTQRTFRTEGARAGHARWPSFSEKTLKTDLGTPKIRYGTDKKPKRTAEELKEYKTKNNLWYKPGIMKGYRSERRYGPNSKLLQASGQFRMSFRVLRKKKNKLTYGTELKLADKIMSEPTRNVLFIMPKDKLEINRLYKNFWLKEMNV